MDDGKLGQTDMPESSRHQQQYAEKHQGLFPEQLRAAATNNMRDLWRKLWRRRGLIAGIVGLATIVSVISVFQITPIYQASSKILIDQRESKVVDINSVLGGLGGDVETIQSEIEVIRSRRLAERVIKALELYKVPEINGALVKPAGYKKYLKASTYVPDEILDVLRDRSNVAVASPEEVASVQRVKMIDAFLKKLAVKRTGRSRVIEIRFSSESPARAALISNRVAELYLTEQLEAKFEATERATKWLDTRLNTLRATVKKSESAVEDYRRRFGLIEGKGATIVSQQTTELNSQLIIARSELAKSEAQLAQVRQLLQSGSIESAAGVLESNLIQRLREQETEVVRKAAELSEEFGEKHPKMINVRAEIRDLRSKIRTEVRKIVRNLQNEVGVARARERSLASSLAGLEQKVGQMNSRQVTLNALEREAAANRTLFETFLSRFKETQNQVDFEEADARIISNADVPNVRAYPNRKRIVLLTIIVSLVVALALVFVVEEFDQGFRSMEQIELMSSIPALGLVPSVRASARQHAKPYNAIIDKPNSAFGESIRSLQAGLMLSNVDDPPKVVLITSAQPNEGKTTIATSLARMSAFVGQKCILIDCDLRQPSVHENLGFRSQPGLVDYLSDSIPLEQVVVRDERTNLHVIPAGMATTSSLNLLQSGHMKLLLDSLAKQYDLVVLDSPPVMAVSDARVLSTLVDKTIFVIRWASTRRQVSLGAIRRLLADGADIAGVALSNVNVKRNARYGYYDSGSYRGAHKKYYGN